MMENNLILLDFHFQPVGVPPTYYCAFITIPYKGLIQYLIIREVTIALWFTLEDKIVVEVVTLCKSR